MSNWAVTKTLKNAEHPRSYASALLLGKNILIHGGEFKGTALNSFLEIGTGIIVFTHT